MCIELELVTCNLPSSPWRYVNATLQEYSGVLGVGKLKFIGRGGCVHCFCEYGTRGLGALLRPC